MKTCDNCGCEPEVSCGNSVVKLNLTTEGPLSGYLNLGPFAKDGVVQANLLHLGTYVDQGECEEIIANGILEKFNVDVAKDALRHWATLLKHGGVLHFSAINLREVVRSVQEGRISPEEFNRLTQEKNSFFVVDELVRFLTELGLRVFSKRFEGLHIHIGAERP